MTYQNPFNPNSVVSTNLFAGRAKQVLTICSKLARLQAGTPASFFLFGERGIGKTALAKLALQIAIDKDPDLYNLNLLTSYYSVEKGQDIRGVLQESANILANNFGAGFVDKIGKTLGQLFDKGTIKIGMLEIGVDTKKDSLANRAASIKDQTVRILSSIIDNIHTKDESRKEGLLIVVDELHNLAKLDEAASILRNVVTTLDVTNRGFVSFLLIGYEEDAEKFFSEDSSAHRTFDSIKLDVMPPEDAKQVLIKGFDKVGVTYDQVALETNIGLAGGYPHSIQMLGFHLMETDKDGNIDSADWSDAAFNTAFDLRTKDFSKMYAFEKPLSIKDKIVHELAVENKPLSKRALEKKLVNKNIYQYIRPLQKVGAIKLDENENLVLQSQLLRTAVLIDDFVRKQKPQGSTPSQ